MTKKQKQLPIATSDSLKARLAGRAPVLVDVPALGLRVRVCRPTFDKLIDIKNRNYSDQDERMAILIASCPDLSLDDLDLLKSGDGQAVASLLAAVTKPITDADVGE